MFYFKTDKKTLLSALQKVEMITRKNLHMFLENVRIEVKQNFVMLSTSRIDMTIHEFLSDVETNVDDDSEVVHVNATQLLKIVKNTKASENIYFETIKDDMEQIQLRITTAKTEYILDCAVNDESDPNQVLDYFEPSSDSYLFTTTKDVYNRAVDKVGFATGDKDEFREAYKGISFNVNNPIELTATDGKVLANVLIYDAKEVSMIQVNEELDGFDFMMPSDMFPHIKRCIDAKKSSDALESYMSFYSDAETVEYGSKVTIKYNSGAIQFIALDTEFPDWRSYINKNELPNNVVFPVDSLRRAVDDLLVLKHRVYPVIAMRIVGDEVCIKSVAAGVGEARSFIETISSTNDTDDEFIVRFNCKILSDIVSKFDSELAVMRYGANDKSFIINPIHVDDEGISRDDESFLKYKYVIMPVYDRTEGNEFTKR